MCLDPSAPCVNDDDATLPGNNDDDVSTGDQIPSYPESYSTSDTQETTSLDCVDVSVSDGICDVDNNNDECGAFWFRLVSSKAYKHSRDVSLRSLPLYTYVKSTAP